MELYRNTANLFVAGFIGSPKMNFIPCEVVEWLGNESLLYTELDQLDECLVVRLDSLNASKTKEVHLWFEGKDCYVFDEKGINCSPRRELE
ncbi:Maltose/maltodextrin import ATP-binding protein MalK [Vibrio thalassae]|uniref:Maltose/maltodextrin import ATP-binding protein MalK n=1 Tax=Vibrio thalassae TaxID=1243014 RepID=A0A240EFI3_9VIBR|nr:hypothetical protein [Vibrio thalassae]SNX46929.1 Maltose/maltodextrin import ATP-binding protein MalK [Vibrio thalassae]